MTSDNTKKEECSDFLAGLGNKLELTDGTIGVIIQVTNGNYLILTNTQTKRWVTRDDVSRVFG